MKYKAFTQNLNRCAPKFDRIFLQNKKKSKSSWQCAKNRKYSENKKNHTQINKRKSEEKKQPKDKTKFNHLSMKITTIPPHQR